MREVREWDEDYISGIVPGEHNLVEFKDARKLDLMICFSDSPVESMRTWHQSSR
jgi:hypothetical protein